MQTLIAHAAAMPVAPVSVVETSTESRRFVIGKRVHSANANGIAWRVKRGAIRLDRVTTDGISFAGLALAGDVIGAETLLVGRYSFNANALSDCELEPWLSLDSTPSGETLLQTLAANETRAADALALRAGEALERVRKLFLLLATTGSRATAKRLAIPELKDIADMTALTSETASRAMSRLRKGGFLEKRGRRIGFIRAGLA